MLWSGFDPLPAKMLVSIVSGAGVPGYAAGVPLPKEMLTTAPAITGYVRGEWWAGRKKAYAEEAAKFLQTVAKNDELVQPVEDDDDALPF